MDGQISQTSPLPIFSYNTEYFGDTNPTAPLAFVVRVGINGVWGVYVWPA